MSNIEADTVQEIAHLVTQDTRHKLLVNILAHPSQSPSLDELTYTNPDRSRSTVAEHLEKLVEYGVVEKLVIPEGSRERSLPHIFYRVTDLGQKFLAQHSLIPVDDRDLQSQYSRVEKPEKIRRYENAPRHGAERKIDSIDREKYNRLAEAVKVEDSVPVPSSPSSDQRPLNDFGAESEEDGQHSSGESAIDGRVNRHALVWIYGCAKEAVKDMYLRSFTSGSVYGCAKEAVKDMYLRSFTSGSEESNPADKDRDDTETTIPPRGKV